MIQTDLSEIERDLTLRRLLWESQEEWDKLAQEWTSNPFDSLNVDSLQKNVNRFTQTVYMLEKGKALSRACVVRFKLIQEVRLPKKKILVLRHRRIK